jgi:glyoxylase-like metal-dependent hydrolase (beta-lactamase superfamily II)
MYNSEEVYIYHLSAAHTDGDSIVMFRRSGVVSTGDFFMPLASYPVIDVDKGGTIDGFIKGLNQIIDLLVPEDAEEGGTYVIPGHGRISDRNDIVNYRDMVTILRGRIAAMVEDGMTLEQVKASKPTADYDVLGHYRETSNRFIEGVYRDLSNKLKSQRQNNAAGTGGR